MTHKATENRKVRTINGIQRPCPSLTLRFCWLILLIKGGV